MNLVALPVALLGAAVAALCSAADGALQSAEPDRTAAGEALAALVPRRDRAHRALSYARWVALLMTGVAAAAVADFGRLADPEALGWGVVVALGLALLCEAVPRAVGDARATPTIRRLVPIIHGAEWLFAPLVALATRFERSLARAFPSAARDEAERETSAAQFRQVVETKADVPRDQRSILQGVFSLGGTEVEDVMVPRIDIMGIETSSRWSDVIARVRSAEHARLPVYRETLDEIVGVLYAKDLLPAAVEGTAPEGGWQRLIRPASFVPEGKPIDAQLRDFKATRTHIAIVVDEYGGTAGLITIEDILEEIVGEIRDEHDDEEQPIESEGGRKFWVSGRVSLEDLSQSLGARFEHEDVATVGGLIFTTLGRVPHSGERLTLNGFRVVVERVARRSIERVYFERPDVPAVQDA